MTDKLRIFATCLLITLGLAGPASALNTQLPDLGASAGSVLSPTQERALGRAFMRSIRREEAVLDDPLLIDYVQQLGEKLVESSPAAGQRFNFFVIDRPEVNAFAGPAGHIGIYTGLILTTETESELASVLAHEIAHVSQHHLLRAWETAQNLTLPSAALLLAAIAVGATVGGDAGIAALAGTQAALLQQQINFTRANEQEADSIGIEILADAQFEPRAMASFFDRLGKANRLYATKLPEFLLTHPVSTSRTADALSRASSYPYTQQHNDDLRYQLVRSQLRQLNQPDAKTAVAEFQRMLDDGRYRNRLATEYGQARALMRADQFAKAEQIIDGLLEQQPDIPEFVITEALLESHRGANQSALRRLEKALLRKPSSYALNVSFAEVALTEGDNQAVARRLHRYLEFNDQDPTVYGLLSRAAGAAGHAAEANLYLSDKYYLSGNLEAAIVQLEIARDLKNLSFFDSSRIESRLQVLKDEDKERKQRE